MVDKTDNPNECQDTSFGLLFLYFYEVNSLKSSSEINCYESN